jgi:DNA topoisomerase I
MSARYLLIVESPAKAKTINKMLGRDFLVKASMGHVRDLPEKKLGVRVEKDFEPEYVILRDRAKALKELKQAAAGVERIYLAPDPDREGEAIAWHLREAMKDVASEEKFLRVTYNEITAPAVRRAIEHPGAIDMDRVNSQQARRVLDRLVGFKVSQLLWRRVRGASSAGRVQSAALRLVCEREEAIRRFEAVEYWILGARVALQHDPRTPFVVRLARIDGGKAEVGSAARAEEIRADLERRGLRVLGEQRRELSRRAPPPFITSSLQQAASRALGMTPPRTMRSAQSLYEGMDLGDGPTGLITYMRTDSVSIAAEAQADARAFVAETYGPDYVPEKPNVYRSRSGAQQAHEAIRPTDVRRTPESLAGVLKTDEARLYRLIWQRFVASQMAPARIAQRTVEVEAEPAPAGAAGHDYLFRATASEVIFPGYQRVTGDDRPKKVAREESDEPVSEGDAEEADALPPVVAGEGLDRLDWLADQKFTEPPPRYSDATLIKAMEENGIGRPSTYAATVQVLHDRKYIEREKRALRPLPLGEKVYVFLTQHLDELFAIKFTARMEEELDEVEAGRMDWHAMLREFYGKFEPWLLAARAPVESDDPAAVRRLLELLAQVREWAPPVTRGKRTYDDAKFVVSIREQLEAGEKVISQPQLDALRKLGARYAAQVPELEAEARALGLPEPGAGGGQAGEAITGRLALFEGIAFDPPREVRGRTYNDGEFIASLRSQAEGGRGLSERQVAALDRVLHKYAAKIPDFEQRAKALGLEEGGAVAAADPAECRQALEALGAVTEWKPPVQRGKRTWDDHAFYDSVRKQFEGKGALSPRQLASLKKMAARYAAAEAKKAGAVKD